MDNITLGIPTIVICLLGYWFAYKKYLQNNFHLSILLIAVCGFILRIYVGSDLFLHDWDERFHVLVAKNLIKHPLVPTLYDKPLFSYDYKNWAGNHVWIAKPIFPLWLISACIWIFGESELAIRIPSLILSTLAIFLTYQIGKHVFNSKVGIIAAFLHSIHGLLIELAGGRISSDHVETAFIVFTELSVLFGVLAIKSKRRILLNALVGVCLGITILCKWAPSLIVIPIWICLSYFSKTYSFKNLLLNFFVLISTTLLICVPWHAYMLLHYPTETKWILHYFISPYSVVLEKHSGEWWYYIDKVRLVFGEIIYLPLLWFLWRIYKKAPDYRLFAIGVWWILPMFIFSLAETKRQTYLLISAPAFFIATSYFFFYCYSVKHKLKWAATIILLLLIALPVRYSIERVKPFVHVERKAAWVQGLKNLKNDIKSENVVLFNTSRYVEAMFYTNFTAYEMIPSLEQINLLKEKGYKIFVCTNDSTQAFSQIE